ncbi:hypothetical protein [Chitinophaga sp. 212800010-3]|uniref:hypothetical protein n=1 Tax=unclassified Chitinophaga TaxID=2619133 RepID=UPI002DE79FF5|nr:hypothetical protein [Chitinophaga sp. 212800010-3]
MSTIVKTVETAATSKSFPVLVAPVILSLFATFLTIGISFGVLPKFIYNQLE